MALSPRQRLGPYEILSPLGIGGMGEVYRAHDSRLARDIAIKVLPTELASDPQRLSRFEREARAASALSHPNIVTVYDVGTSNSVSYMAIELIDGKTLHDLLVPGPLPIRELLGIAAQVAEGLAAAHEAGIIHRDLKPRNVMVSRSGFAKILDFGLAKVQEPVPGVPAGSREETAPQLGATLSTPGLLVGTTDYMSPEQARGKSVDFRSDQFSFGSILYEMTTGRRAFSHATSADTLTAILRLDPAPIAQLRPDAPPPLRWIIDRCLAKSASDRYASTQDLARELQALREHLTEVSGEHPADAVRPKPRRLVPWLVAGLAVLAAASAWLFFGRSHRVPEPDFRRLTFRDGVVFRALFVPKSNSILYTASWDGQRSKTYLTLPESRSADRPLDAEVQLPMAYTEEGSQVLVLIGNGRAAINAKGTLAWWPALGGTPRRIGDGAGWADWNDKRGLIAVVRDAGPERVLELLDVEGSPKRALFRTLGAISYVRFSPDGTRVGFIHHPARDDDAGQVYIAKTDGSEVKGLTPRLERCAGVDWNRRTGEIWFTASRSSPYSSALYAASVSGAVRRIHSFPEFLVLQRISDDGERCLLVSNVSETRLVVRHGAGPWRDLSWLGWSMAYDISPDERNLLFLDGGTTEKTSGTYYRPLDGGEAVKLWDGEPGAFAPDGHSIVALTSPASGPAQLALVPFPSGPSRQLTFSKVHYSAPSFAGRATILFVRAEAGRSEVWRMQSDGTGARSLGAAGCNTPIGNPSRNVFVCRGGSRENALFLYPMEKGPGRKFYELTDGIGGFVAARWNTDGDRVLAMGEDGRLLVIDPFAGKLVREEPPPAEVLRASALRAVALNSNGTIQAMSVASSSSVLYLCSGLWNR